eukprot:gnl/TRDRNA2_/TRDRNA2_156466_c3_seq2.p1 gnl/TRDRNA2_/TRDRNA2_156466_c3~~gnl/TRDRNA2_/TRDRNA2_156466_c3_seq2.p1  ORF type:complete len:121 (-),score=19.28 gnl/TRDRNA2_/TRDRNA2_156466_c3_seq2:174-536(-)
MDQVGIALLHDTCGICLHTTHQQSTSGTVGYRQVFPDEEEKLNELVQNYMPEVAPVEKSEVRSLPDPRELKHYPEAAGLMFKTMLRQWIQHEMQKSKGMPQGGPMAGPDPQMDFVDLLFR